MDKDYFAGPRELQLDQLPEGTKVQVRSGPLAFSYKKIDRGWVLMDSDHRVYSEPLVEDCFSLGTIAIDPDGVGYVKGFAGCSLHTESITGCLCARPIRWLRAGRMPRPVLQVLPPEDSFSAGFICVQQPVTSYVGGSHTRPGPYIPGYKGYYHSTGVSNGNASNNGVGMTGVAQQSSTAYGCSEHVYQAVNDLPASCATIIDQTHPIDVVADDGLQYIQARLVPDGFAVYFDRRGDGIPLEEIDMLDNESPAFRNDASLGTKASIRFRFKYWQNIPDAKRYTDKRKQVNVRRGRCKEGTPISLRALASHIRRELMAEMTAMACLGYPLSHGDVEVKSEEFVLVRIERTKPGTLQPVFRLRR